MDVCVVVKNPEWGLGNEMSQYGILEYERIFLINNWERLVQYSHTLAKKNKKKNDQKKKTTTTTKKNIYSKQPK